MTVWEVLLLAALALLAIWLLLFGRPHAPPPSAAADAAVHWIDAELKFDSALGIVGCQPYPPLHSFEFAPLCR